MKRIFALFAIVILLNCFIVSPAQAQTDTIDLYFFYGQNCPHCSRMETFLTEMETQYPELNVLKFETYFNQDNRTLFEQMAADFGTEIKGVPTVFINAKVIVGFSNSIAEQVEQAIQDMIAEPVAMPTEADEAVLELTEDGVIEIVGESSPSEEPTRAELLKKVTVPAVLSAAAVDAINPCAFAVLIILLTTILATKSKRRSLMAGLAFSASIFISYLLMGIGLYSAIAVAGLSHNFYIVVAVLAILLGLFNLKDVLWYGKWFVMEVPMSWRPKLKSLLRGITSVPGAFLIGFVISLFLLPCTSGPYIVILGLLAQVTTRNVAFAYLVLYNLIFILPMIIITLGIYFGFTTTEQAEAWRQKRLTTLHLIAGMILLLLGIGMFIALALGMV